MKHSIEELIALAHTYFPKGMTPSDPGYAQTREVRNQREPRVPASAKYDTWRAMLARLDARFPRDRFPGVTLANHSLFLQVATASTSDRCFTGTFWLPPQSVEERDRELSFFVSFVVPYYVMRGTRFLLNGETTRQGKPAVNAVSSFEISPADEPFAKAIAEEIEATFPGHEPMPPEVGLTIVPDVVAGRGWFGEATLFGCLFSDDM